MSFGQVFRDCIARGIVNTNDDTAAVFYDLDEIARRAVDIQSAFPSGSLHTTAIKANPLPYILQKLGVSGFGFECAGRTEIELALRAGAKHERIVFDSPAKTKEELEFALRSGLYINADSVAELERISGILTGISSESIIGLRINPQIGSGTISSTGVSAKESKFGVPLADAGDSIYEMYRRYPWLNGIHVHIGSQGYPVEKLVQGIKLIVQLAGEINKMTGGQIKYIDIGGGLPVKYKDTDTEYTMEDYSSRLKIEIPELFSGGYTIVTEFGRYIHANAGLAVSRVEYVKPGKERDILIIHLGADLFLRKSYNPQDWHHQISVLNPDGSAKTNTNSNMRQYHVAGPLCFSGDIIAYDVLLPVVSEGDYIVIHDAGAYTLSMWSRYNSRQIPKIIGFSVNNQEIITLKSREPLSAAAGFWN